MHFLDSYEEQLRQKEVNMTAIVKNDIENNIMKVNEEISNIIHAQRIKNLQTLQVGCPKYKIFFKIPLLRIYEFKEKNLVGSYYSFL